MPDVSGNAYALTVLSPIKNGYQGDISYADALRNRLQCLGLNEASPMAKVPDTYVARFFLLDDVFYESTPACDPFCGIKDLLSIFSAFSSFWDRFRLAGLPREDHLQSRYLVFCSDFHGDLNAYLRGMWDAISADIQRIWEPCVGFERVQDAESFSDYIKNCQVTANTFFMGSTDDALAEQLKALYLKQELAKFAVQHQGLGAAELQQAFQSFIARVQPDNLAGPTWNPGQTRASA